MVTMRLISNKNGIIRYSYRPENQGEPGIISYDKIYDVRTLEKLAENDRENSSFYRSQVYWFIYDNEDNPPLEGSRIWY